MILEVTLKSIMLKFSSTIYLTPTRPALSKTFQDFGLEQSVHKWHKRALSAMRYFTCKYRTDKSFWFLQQPNWVLGGVFWRKRGRISRVGWNSSWHFSQARNPYMASCFRTQWARRTAKNIYDDLIFANNT